MVQLTDKEFKELTTANYTALSKHIEGIGYDVIAKGNNVVDFILDLVKPFPQAQKILSQVKEKLQTETFITS